MNADKGIIDKILINPEWRIGRHVLLVAALAVISFNQAFLTFGQTGQLQGWDLRIVGFITLVMYLMLVYFNIYRLVPELLLKRKYRKYIAVLSVSVLLFLIMQLVEEYGICRYFNLPPLRTGYFNFVTVADIISNFLLNMICVCGISLTVLLKYWMTDSQRLGLLEKKHLVQEVEQLKEQIEPDLLFKILNRTAALSKIEPEKASDMLYRLSQLLRYQLYDSGREKLLLSSVISFLENYLFLEKTYSGKIDYEIETEGDIIGVFVPPMLFLPFIKEVITEIYRSVPQACIRIRFTVRDEILTFVCACREISFPEEKRFSDMRTRLDMLYKDNYKLIIHRKEKNGPDNIELELHDESNSF